MRVALVNVGIGNIDSVERALNYLGVPYKIVSNAASLEDSSHIVLPGVGAFRAGMDALYKHDLVGSICSIAKAGDVRILGICLGMQLMGAYSEEGDCEGLGLLPYSVTRLSADSFAGIKVPHVGFSPVYAYETTGLFSGLGDRSDFYFTHSYALRDVGVPCNHALCVHGQSFVAAFDAGSLSGVQFHPEKSQANGLRLLKNFFHTNYGA